MRKRRPASGATVEWTAAMRLGKEQAEMVLQRRRERAARRRRARGKSAGLLVAEGDSWFDYPFFDVLEELEEEFDYSIESVAHKGDTVEEMAYDPSQLDKLARTLAKLAAARRVPRAILLSGGGNDIAGDGLCVLLNHKGSGLAPLCEPVVAGLVDERLRCAIVTLASAVTRLCQASFGTTLPILIHGYDYPVPDGRGYLGGFWILPGPWLAPGFRKKGYPDDQLQQRCEIMVTLIDRFNALLAGIAGGPGLEHLSYVNLRGSLSPELSGKAYKDWWSDELHPTEQGFTGIAGRFHAVLRSL